MPAKSPAQKRLMEAAAHTPGGYGGVPQKVGKEFTQGLATGGEVEAPVMPGAAKGALGPSAYKIHAAYPSHFIVSGPDNRQMTIARTPGLEAMFADQLKAAGIPGLPKATGVPGFAEGTGPEGLPAEPQEPDDLVESAMPAAVPAPTPDITQDPQVLEWVSKHPGFGTAQDLEPGIAYRIKRDLNSPAMQPANIRAKAIPTTDMSKPAPVLPVGQPVGQPAVGGPEEDPETAGLQTIDNSGAGVKAAAKAKANPSAQPTPPIGSPEYYNGHYDDPKARAAAIAAHHAAMTHTPNDPEVIAANQQATPAAAADAARDAFSYTDPPGPYDKVYEQLSPALEAENKTITTQAENASGFQNQLATMEKARAGAVQPPPPPSPIDPTDKARRVGQAFGATSPLGQRIMGGISMGLMSGLGEFGAALSHRSGNGAAQIIQNSIAQNIQAQTGNNALTRQQWLDQSAYHTEVTNHQIASLAATAKGQDIKDSAAVLMAQNRMAMWQSLAQRGLMKPEQAEPLTAIENARVEGVRMAGADRDALGEHNWGDSFTNWLQNKTRTDINPAVAKAFSQWESYRNAVGQALFPIAKRQPGDNVMEQVDRIIGNPGEAPEIRRSRYQVVAQRLRTEAANIKRSAVGVDPYGAAVSPSRQPLP